MGYEGFIRGLREPFEGGVLCPGLEELHLGECIVHDMTAILSLDQHFFMNRSGLKLIRGNFGSQIDYDDEDDDVSIWSRIIQGLGVQGFEVGLDCVSATKSGTTLTRKINGATVILTSERVEPVPRERDTPIFALPSKFLSRHEGFRT